MARLFRGKKLAVVFGVELLPAKSCRLWYDISG